MFQQEVYFMPLKTVAIIKSAPQCFSKPNQVVLLAERSCALRQ